MKTPEEIKLEKAIEEMKKIKFKDTIFDIARRWNSSEHRHLVKISDDVYREETDDEFRNRLKRKYELMADLEHFLNTSKSRELNSFEKGIKEEVERLLNDTRED